MTLETLLEQVEALGDFARKPDILHMIQTNNLEDAKALATKLCRQSCHTGPEFTPGASRVLDTKVYSKLEDLLEDFIWTQERQAK